MSRIYLLIMWSLNFTFLAAQTGEWNRVIPRTEVYVRYYSPEKTESFAALQRNSGEAKDKLAFSDKNISAEINLMDRESHIELSCNVSSLIEAEQCFTLRLVFPVEKTGNILWNHDLDLSIPVNNIDTLMGNFARAFTVPPPDSSFNAGTSDNGGYGDKVGTGIISFYPLASVTAGKYSLDWAVDMGIPVVYRLAYDARQGIIAEFDLALSSMTKKFPGRAFFKLYLFGHDTQWGMRSALEKYYMISGDYFKKRVISEGIWLPFTPLHTIEDFQDFGFAFHETHWPTKDTGTKDTLNTIAADKQAGVYSFQYTEPWDIQIPIARLNMAYAEVTGAEVIPKEHMSYLPQSAVHDKNGLYQARRLKTPWFDSGWAVSITTNVDPEIKGFNRYWYVRQDEIDPALKMDVDGIYFDSMEWNWHHDLNYNKEHFAATDYPLTFSASLENPEPAIWNYASEYEMMRTIAHEMHMQGKLTMGNGFGWTPFAPGVLDLFGSEFSWYYKGDYDKKILQFRRAISFQKPIVFLLNEGFDDPAFTEAPYDGYRQYFEHMLFYGFFPSFFSADASNNPYWNNKTKYNQGRPYFIKYIPLIKRIAQAGWQPVTYASTAGKTIPVERFGNGIKEGIYFTLFNEGRETVKTTLNIERQPLELNGRLNIKELITGNEMKAQTTKGEVKMEVDIPSRSARLLYLSQ